MVIALIGNLGAGKTTFVQKFAKALGISETVTSPTFVILKKYGTFIHVDAYRITSTELLALGFRELVGDPRNVIVIEWADRVMDTLPKDAMIIKFEHVSATKRKISFD